MSLRKSASRSVSADQVLTTALLPSSTTRMVSSPSFLLRHSMRNAITLHLTPGFHPLKEGVDDLREQYVLGQEDLALHDLERRFRVAPQEVVAPPAEHLHLVLQPVLVGVELG